MMRALVVQSKPAVTDALEHLLTKVHFQVKKTDMPDTAVDLGALYDFDIIILDTKLPEWGPYKNGLDVLEALRDKQIMTPVIIFGEDGTLDTKLKAFALGIDDYATRPMHQDELIARIFAITRRTTKPLPKKVTFGPFEVDTKEKKLSVNDHVLHLTPRQYNVLEILALNRDGLVKRDSIVRAAFNNAVKSKEKSIDVAISQIRTILEPHDGRNFILPVHKQGYRLVDDPDQYEQRGARLAPVKP